MSTVTSPVLDHNAADAVDAASLGSGAVFWAYVSPQNDTANVVTKWRVTVEHSVANWCGEITSDKPTVQLHTTDLSGLFYARVTASGPNFESTKLVTLDGSKGQVSCSSSCAAMIGIVADADGKGAKYWTVSDAFCKV